MSRPTQALFLQVRVVRQRPDFLVPANSNNTMNIKMSRGLYQQQGREAMIDLMKSPDCARKLRSLADPDRLRIIQCLRAGDRNVSELAELLKMTVANISHHLRDLRHADVVIDAKQGRFVVYGLNPSIYQCAQSGEVVDHLNLGCCRLEMPRNE